MTVEPRTGMMRLGSTDGDPADTGRGPARLPGAGPALRCAGRAAPAGDHPGARAARRAPSQHRPHAAAEARRRRPARAPHGAPAPRPPAPGMGDRAATPGPPGGRPRRTVNSVAGSLGRSAPAPAEVSRRSSAAGREIGHELAPRGGRSSRGRGAGRRPGGARLRAAPGTPPARRRALRARQLPLPRRRAREPGRDLHAAPRDHARACWTGSSRGRGWRTSWPAIPTGPAA